MNRGVYLSSCNIFMMETTWDLSELYKGRGLDCVLLGSGILSILDGMTASH